MEVRTRFAPSPTGFMHIGNLRTALYEYLIAKSQNGKFILRIEDTDQNRVVEDAQNVIYGTLKAAGLDYDEGPFIGGDFGPYIQGERMHIYAPYAHKLVEEGKAYYCFCTKERLDSLKADCKDEKEFTSGYDRKCRDLTAEEIENNLQKEIPYVIRQKMPLEGVTTFEDTVFGSITVNNSELEDQIILKSDGYPTYNFANIIDDHLMSITHVVRGSEYLSSTPKYNLLYQAFGWEVPVYVHLPLIMGKNSDGTVSKLSKRHGSTSFSDLVKEGYLPKAIINYIALLGWCPKDNREIFTLDELVGNFSVDRINKSPSIFDYEKLKWFNSEHIKLMPNDEFIGITKKYLKGLMNINNNIPFDVVADILKPRITTLNDIPELVDFLNELPEYQLELFINKKSKTNLENSKTAIERSIKTLGEVEVWNHDSIYNALSGLAGELSVKNGAVMWPVRIAISGKTVTPGGAIEILMILGKEESMGRLELGLKKLTANRE